MPNGVSGSCNLLSIFHIEKQQWPKYNITENIRVITSCSIHLDVEWANVQQRHSRSNSRRWSRLSKYYFHIASIISASVETNRFVGLIRTTCPDPIRDWFPSFISTLSRWKKSEMLDALGAEWEEIPIRILSTITCMWRTLPQLGKTCTLHAELCNSKTLIIPGVRILDAGV